MNYENIVEDFVDRTRQNLLATDALPRVGERRFYEVTQLINSLLGLIVVPSESMADRLAASPPQSLLLDGRGPKLCPAQECGPTSLQELVRGMRNAVAHFRVETVEEDLTGQIQSVTLWNATPQGVHLWGVQFTTGELRAFVERLADEVQAAVRSRRRTPAGPPKGAT